MRRTILSIFLVLLGMHFATAQSLTISGTVTSADDGLPLPGVSVVIQGTTQGTSTDLDGNYSISVQQGQTLLFTSIGFKDQMFTVGGGSRIDVAMETDAVMLEEVVAIGYGVMKKSDLTGSVSSVKADQLQRSPAANLDQALQGLAAGVTVNSGSGQPGAAAEVRIRGIGTVNNSAPIYVVDGMIVDDISFLNPNDIASTEILKDASATAIYGSRGANGVILVTTKKGGTDGKINVTIDMYAGVQSAWRHLDLMGASEFAHTLASLSVNAANQLNVLDNDGLDAWLRQYYIGKSGYYPTNLDYSTVDTDWQDEVFRNAAIQNYHVSVSGGNEKTQWTMSGGWFSQDGTIIGSDFERMTIRANSAHKIAKWLKIGENLTFTRSEGRNAMNNNSNPGASILSAAIAMAPWDPARYPHGSKNASGEDLSGRISAASNFKNVTNPLSMVYNSEPSDKTERWLGDVFLELTPVKGLTFRSDVSLDLTNIRHSLFQSAYEYSSFDKREKNFIERSMTRYSTVMLENTLTYARDIRKHSFSAMVGQTLEEYNYYSMGGSGSSILNPEEKNWYLSQATEDQAKATDSASRTRRLSFLGRLHYSYDSRYLITVNFRADGSSKFLQHKWGFFPSTALAWRISGESWMSGVTWLDDLKIRAGWGQIGNDQIGDDAFVLEMMNTGPTFVDYPLGTGSQALVPGATILTYVNSSGKWETTEQWNVGVDFGMFNDRFTGTLDLFLRDTKDMLMSVTAPAHVGNRYAATANVGTVRNKGIELSLNHRNRVGQVDYSIGGNVSFIGNELTALNGGSVIYGDKTICDQGLPLYTFWGYKYEGIYRSEEEIKEHLPKDYQNYAPGDARYADLDGDGKISDADRTAIGNPFPWLTYGLNLSAAWKGIDVSLFFQGVYGNEIYNAVRLRTEGTGNEATLSTTMRDVWTASNPGGSIPNPNGSPNNKFDSSRFVEDGSYLRLKNLQIGYSFPERWISKAKMSRLRIYFSASNLFTVTGYSGYDPEVGGGVDYGNYPQSRTFMLGLNINF